MLVHLYYSEAAALKFEAVALFGNTVKPGEQKTSERLKAFVARQLQMKLGFKVTQILGAIEEARRRYSSAWQRQ